MPRKTIKVLSLVGLLVVFGALFAIIGFGTLQPVTSAPSADSVTVYRFCSHDSGDSDQVDQTAESTTRDLELAYVHADPVRQAELAQRFRITTFPMTIVVRQVEYTDGSRHDIVERLTATPDRQAIQAAVQSVSNRTVNIPVQQRIR